MTGMRDVLIHGYFDVDIDLVYDTAHDQVPKLKEQIFNLLEGGQDGNAVAC
ncbi:DUF86 domain-containing protein [Candidatus Gottesmanbacteria bacterium]|nr:DUF86 domain-containing protein [Candidatus Gottesmanbacteria bacterium]